MIYLDYAATTPIRPSVLAAMKPYYETEYYNPSSLYSASDSSRKAIRNAREIIAGSIGCSPEEIYFTGSGSEADNWIIKGVIDRKLFVKQHIITSTIEHHAILNACKYLEQLKLAEITYLRPDEKGVIDAKDVENNIKGNTVLVSIMAINNEIGAIQPISEIGEICRKSGVLFHTDAVQAYGKLEIDVAKMNIDALSVSAHKFGGPKGVGFLYLKNTTKIHPLIHGGQQERGKRAGTENVAGIVGLGEAARVTIANMDDELNVEKNIKYKTWISLTKRHPEIKINGHAIVASPSILNLNFSAYPIRAEVLAEFLNVNGIAVSSGSACNSQSGRPSHVLKAIGLSNKEADCSIRVSFGFNTTMDEAMEFVNVIDNAIKVLGDKT